MVLAWIRQAKLPVRLHSDNFAALHPNSRLLRKQHFNAPISSISAALQASQLPQRTLKSTNSSRWLANTSLVANLGLNLPIKSLSTASHASTPLTDFNTDNNAQIQLQIPANDSESNKKRQGLRHSRPKRTDTAYNQWGFLRHKYADAELKQAQRAFDYWKRQFYKITKKSKSISNPSEILSPLLQHEDISAMRQAWQELEPGERRRQWPKLMLSIIRSAPSKTVMVLNATLDPLPPGYAINDVLAFCATRAAEAEPLQNRQHTLASEALLDLAVHMLEDIPQGEIPFRQRTFGLLAKALPAEQTNELYNTLQRTLRQLHPNTKLQFAAKLGRHVHTKPVAFEILKQLAEDGYNLQLPQFSSTLTTLLHSPISAESPSTATQPFSSKAALEHFMEQGYTPNTVTFTAFLDSMAHEVECEEVIRLALLFAESGVKLDARTWSNLFRTAKHSMNVNNISKALDVAKVASVGYREVLNNALHAVFYFATMELRDGRPQVATNSSIFKPMLRMYAKQFDLEPLQRWLPDTLPLLLDTAPLGSHSALQDTQSSLPREYDGPILATITDLFSNNSTKKLKPSSTTIATMLRAYIRSLHSSYDLLSYYNFFKQRLEESSNSGSLWPDMMKDQGSLIHDTFILSMTNKRGMVRPALSVFGDMLRDYLKHSAIDEAGSSRIQTPYTSAHPPPSLITFNLLIRGLFSQGDVKMAEKVIQVMKEHGHEPDKVTWNTLIRGYSSMQSVNRTVTTLQAMESSGLKPDAFTFKAFGKLNDQSRAFEIMEDIININQRKLSEGGM